MKHIGVISDTHGMVPEGGFIKFLKPCDEIWHAGDIGDIRVIEFLERYKPVKGVFGNIDGLEVRKKFPEYLEFNCEKIQVLIIHIGGRPGRYDKTALTMLKEISPDLFICGHSHILRIQYDKTHGFLYVNPGAAGNWGLHHVRTGVRFKIDGNEIRNMEIYEADR